MIRKVLSGIFRFLSWLVYLVIIAALLIAAPILLGNRPMTILSGSMEPTYPVGSIVYLKAAAFEDLQVGDAITFRLGESDSVATHRIVEIDTENQTFTTKGDANPSNDPTPVSYSSVEGRVSNFAIPYIGFFLYYVKNWYIIGGMALILFLNMLLAPSDEEEKGRKKEKDRKKRSSKESVFADLTAEPDATAPTSSASYVPPAVPEASVQNIPSAPAAPAQAAQAAPLSDVADNGFDPTKEKNGKKSSNVSAADFFSDL